MSVRTTRKKCDHIDERGETNFDENLELQYHGEDTNEYVLSRGFGGVGGIRTVAVSEMPVMTVFQKRTINITKNTSTI